MNQANNQPARLVDASHCGGGIDRVEAPPRSPLGRDLSAGEHNEDEAELRGPAGRWLIFLRVPEPKTVKNRMHLCLRPVDRSRDDEVERLLGLGATLVNDLRTGDTGWAVLADPEGNEFCVLATRAHEAGVAKQ